MHFGIVFLASGGQPHTMTFNLEGDQIWAGTQPPSRIIPQVDPFDRVIVSFGQTGLRAITPLNQEIWTTLHPSGASQVIRPAIGASRTLYSGDSLGVDLWALNPDGTTKWVRPSMPGMSLRALGVSPDESVIVAYGTGPETTGRIWGFDTADGSLIWEIALQDENGSTQLVSSYEPIFTPDSQTAYITTDFTGALPEHGYVYALRIQPGVACYANCDDSTAEPVLNIADFACYLTRFAAQDPYANCDHSTTPPMLTVADFACFLQRFAAGCP
jgi:outer membrane protein assembly factor BamB